MAAVVLRLLPCFAIACGRLDFDPVCVEGAQTTPDRSAEWTGGTVQGMTAGNPTAGQPSWSYEQTTGGGLAAGDAWFTQAGTLLSWDTDWFAQGRGVWAFSDDQLPLIDRTELTQAFDADRIAIIRLRNTLDVTLAITVSGAMQIRWEGFTGPTPTTVPIDVEVVLAHLDADRAVMATMLATTVAKPTANTTPELATVTVPTRTLFVDPGDSIVWSVRPTAVSVENAWITVSDDGLAFDVRPCL
jgi:hypothetical protein